MKFTKTLCHENLELYGNLSFDESSEWVLMLRESHIIIYQSQQVHLFYPYLHSVPQQLQPESGCHGRQV